MQKFGWKDREKFAHCCLGLKSKAEISAVPMGLRVTNATCLLIFWLPLKANVSLSAAALSRGRGCFPADSAKLHFNPILLRIGEMDYTQQLKQRWWYRILIIPHKSESIYPQRQDWNAILGCPWEKSPWGNRIFFEYFFVSTKKYFGAWGETPSFASFQSLTKS